MPPRQFSRYSFCQALRDEEGRTYLTERVPFGFRVLADTYLHTVVQGDTLFALAGRHYAGLPRPSGLWWVIADFQPEPILDPTIALVPGSRLFIPSLRAVQELIFNEQRRYEDDI